MIWDLIEVAAILIECFMVARFIIKYFGLRSEDHKLLKWVGLFLCLSAVDFIGSIVIWNETMLVMVFTTTCALFSFVFLKGNPFEKAVICVLSYMMFYFINLPVLAISSLLADMSPIVIADTSTQHIVRVIGIFITKLLYFVATEIVLTIRKKEKYQFRINEWIIVISAFITTLAIGFCINIVVKGTSFSEYVYIIITLLLSFLDVIIFVFTGKINRANKKAMDEQHLKNQLIHQQHEIQQLEHQYKEISILRHGHKNQLNCLKLLIEQNDSEEAKKYLDQCIGNHINSQQSHIHCASSVLNVIINDKFSKAEELNILTSCKILTKIPEHLEYDLSIIISNMLDNAIEACVKNSIPSQIVLIISETAGYFRVTIKNTIQESVLEKNSELKTDKKNKELHGWGIRSVKDIARKRNGFVDIYEKNGLFIASVMLMK
jgi:sensor histidine kinase YesM